MVGKDRPQSSNFFVSAVEAKKIISSPDLQFRFFSYAWKDTRNPIFVWNAIHLCTKHDKQFPDWVLGYLAGCSARMLAPDAKKSSDLRKILPSIFGFPAKRGPGKPLDPDHDPNKGGRALALNALFDEWVCAREGEPIPGLVRYGTVDWLFREYKQSLPKEGRPALSPRLRADDVTGERHRDQKGRPVR